MNFTREPIIESIISSNDGYKLRLTKLNNRGNDCEDFLVDALELVTYGRTCFYRHKEKPKSFLVPVSEYEITEVRDARLSLKYATIDKSIKITAEKEVKKTDSRGQNVKNPSKQDSKSKIESKRNTKKTNSVKTSEKNKDTKNNTEIDPSVIKVLAPPSSLISDSLKKYKSIDIGDKENLALLSPPVEIVDTPIVTSVSLDSKEEKKEKEKVAKENKSDDTKEKEQK